MTTIRNQNERSCTARIYLGAKLLTAMVLLVAPAIASCCGGEDDLPQKIGPTNLLFIVVDTLRADQIALHGGPTATPNIEALAKRGVLFEQAYSHAPITGPSHASMFTSMLPSRHGVHNNADVLRPNYVTLAEILKGQSCATAAFISLEALKSKYKVLQGFDAIYEEFPHYWWKTAGELNEEMLPWLDDNSSRPFFLLAHYSDPHGPYVPPSWYQTVEITLNGNPIEPILIDGRYHHIELALRPGENTVVFTSKGDHRIHLSRWKFPKGLSLKFSDDWGRPAKKPGDGRILEARSSAAMTVTNGTTPTTSTIRVKSHFMLSVEQKQQGYAQETAYVDAQIGELFKRMTALGLWNNTMVVFTSDHGEELGERNGVFEHVQRLYESLVHVPLIIALPNEKNAGRRVSEPVRHIDLLPTIGHFFDLKSPPDIQGKNLWPLKDIGIRPAVSETYRPQARSDRVSVRNGDFKLIRDERTKKEELYNLRKDPLETKSLISQVSVKGERVAGFASVRTMLNRILETERTPTTAKDAPAPIRAKLNEDEVESLRALGYLE